LVDSMRRFQVGDMQVAHYRFLTADTCLDVIASAPPNLSIVS
jgi:hypothetical protein